MFRERAFEAPGLWAGQVTTGPGVVSGWHHHDRNESGLYVVRGVLRFECEGVEGYVDAHPGDFVHVPALTVHRESNPTDEPSVCVIARAGTGVPPSTWSRRRHRTADPTVAEEGVQRLSRKLRHCPGRSALDTLARQPPWDRSAGLGQLRVVAAAGPACLPRAGVPSSSSTASSNGDRARPVVALAERALRLPQPLGLRRRARRPRRRC